MKLGSVWLSITALLCLGVKSSLNVFGPEDLINEIRAGDAVEMSEGDSTDIMDFFIPDPQIRANYANFGHVPYGQSLTGTLYFDKSNPDQCTKTTSDTIDAYEQELYNENEDAKNTFPSKIAIARRGNCTFVNKVRNIERAGFSLAIIVDDKAENITNVIMGDDGTGTGLRIPAMLIGRSEGELLIQYAAKPVPVNLAAQFDVKNAAGVADVELWYSSNSVRALDFIKEMDNYAHRLGDNVNIKPRYVTWSCQACDFQFRQDECFSNGKYCAPNHIKDDFHRIDGKDIIYEDLRQSCIHDIVTDEGQQHLWWDYMKEVHKECFGFISKACSKNAHKAIGLDWAKTKQCVDDSFLGEDHSKAENTILQRNSEQWQEYGTLYWPSVTINRMTFRGDITAANVLEDICANLIEKPQVCTDYANQENIRFNEVVVEGGDSTVSPAVLILIVTILIAANVILIVAYRRCVKKEMQETMNFRVSNAVSQYVSVAQLDRQAHSNTSLEVDQ